MSAAKDYLESIIKLLRNNQEDSSVPLLTSELIAKLSYLSDLIQDLENDKHLAELAVWAANKQVKTANEYCANWVRRTVARMTHHTGSYGEACTHLEEFMNGDLSLTESQRRAIQACINLLAAHDDRARGEFESDFFRGEEENNSTEDSPESK